MMYRLFILLLFVSLNSVAQQTIKSSDPHLHYNGRMILSSDSVRLEWPGSSVKIRFTGTQLSVSLRDEHSKNRYNVIVDGAVTSIFTPDSIRNNYVLAKNLTQGTHTVELFKRTEAGMGGTILYGFSLEPSAILLQVAPSKRLIEFYGNSITCGMAIGDTLKTGVDENNYLAYGAVTARLLNSDYTCIAKSGIGLMASWFPEIMPEVYDRVYESNSVQKWDFKTLIPQVVVVDLGQNDSWIVNLPQNEQFKRRFGSNKPTGQYIINAYMAFYKALRQKYPNAHIVCTLGSMDATKAGSPWPGYVETAAANLHDANLSTLIFPYDPPAGKKDAHPGISQHQAMANMLRAHIIKKMGW